jgi:hypothetical protein
MKSSMTECCAVVERHVHQHQAVNRDVLNKTQAEVLISSCGTSLNGQESHLFYRLLKIDYRNVRIEMCGSCSVGPR